MLDTDGNGLPAFTGQTPDDVVRMQGRGDVDVAAALSDHKIADTAANKTGVAAQNLDQGRSRAVLGVEQGLNVDRRDRAGGLSHASSSFRRATKPCSMAAVAPQR